MRYISTMKHKMAGYTETKALINAVRDRPALYDPRSPHYNDKDYKTEMWNEVFQLLTPSWSTLTKTSQAKRGKDVQRRWKSIRDAFVKEVRALKEEAEADHPPAYKRKPYVYYDLMAFLTPMVEHRRTYSSLVRTGGYCSDNNDDASLPSSDFPFCSMMAINSDSMTDDGCPPADDDNLFPDEVVATTFADDYNCEIDEDRLFMLSLVPSIKRLEDEQKSSIKIKIAQIIHEAVFGTSSTPIPGDDSVNNIGQSVDNIVDRNNVDHSLDKIDNTMDHDVDNNADANVIHNGDNDVDHNTVNNVDKNSNHNGSNSVEHSMDNDVDHNVHHKESDNIDHNMDNNADNIVNHNGEGNDDHDMDSSTDNNVESNVVKIGDGSVDNSNC